MNRRRVLAGVVSVSCGAFLSGCAGEPTSDASLEARNVVPANRKNGWEVEFDVRYEQRALSEEEGVFGVEAHLFGDEEEPLSTVELGDYDWSRIPERNREVSEGRTNIYRGEVTDGFSTTTEEFPKWIGITIEEFDLTWSRPEIYGAEYAPSRDVVGTIGWEKVQIREYSTLPPERVRPDEPTTKNSSSTGQ